MTVPAAAHTHVSRKASLFTESVIREMTREAMKYGAVNLSQGFPDFAARTTSSASPCKPSPTTSINTQSPGERKVSRRDCRQNEMVSRLEIDPETEITVTCGSTEGMIAAMMATVDPGEEVVVFEPFMRTTRQTQFCRMPGHDTSHYGRQTGVSTTRTACRFQPEHESHHHL